MRPSEGHVASSILAGRATRFAIRCLALAGVTALAFTGCATRPLLGSLSDRDGPPADPPASLASLPDAEPHVELLRPLGANKPYEALGEVFVPQLADTAMAERGLASWYGRKFHGRPTASGERYDMYAMTAAHRTMPIPSYARVRNPANGHEIVVRVNDRGPFHRGWIIDLSYAAASKLGVLGGVAPVELERITNDDIRTGLWRNAPRGAATPPPPPEPEPEPPRQPAADDALLALADSRDAAGWWLQLGAFRERAGAERLQARAIRADRDARAVIVDDGMLRRVHAGPYPSREAALAAAERWRRLLGSTPLLVEPPAP